MTTKIFLLSLTIILSISNSAYAGCKEDAYNECYRNEQHIYGLETSSVCAANAIAICGSSSYSSQARTPELNDIGDCSDLAERTGRWDKDVYHDCMGTPTDSSFRW